jgi:hypothetical protein
MGGKAKGEEEDLALQGENEREANEQEEEAGRVEE